MKGTPFLLLLLGIAFIWLGLTGRLGAVLAAVFTPGKLSDGSSASGAASGNSQGPPSTQVIPPPPLDPWDPTQA
jgi:hypothetical protein